MSFSVHQISHLYDFRSHYLDRNGLRYHYLDEGTGDPVVMVHGNPSWSFMYRKLVSAFRESYRVVVPDHIGCGLSDKPGDAAYPYRLEARVLDLEALLNRIGVDRNITLVVHDWGGPIGMTYAIRHPERIARLVVFNTTAFLVPPGKRLHWSIRLCRDSRIAALMIRRFNAFALVASWMGCPMRPMSWQVRRAYTGPYDSWGNRIATLRFVQDIPLRSSDASYATLLETQEGLGRLQEIPTLICWGEKDFVFDGDFLDEWIRRFPAAEVLRFAEAGHYVVEEVPEAIIERLRSFLSSHPVPEGK